MIYKAGLMNFHSDHIKRTHFFQTNVKTLKRELNLRNNTLHFSELINVYTAYVSHFSKHTSSEYLVVPKCFLY